MEDIIGKTEFTYAELEPAAQQKALDKEDRDPGYDWWNWVYEDVVTTAALIGIDIDVTTHTPKSGHLVSDISITFSGFWSQGDGCAFTGNLLISSMKGAVEKVTRGAPTEELLAFAVRAEDIYNVILAASIARRMIGDEDDHNLYWVDTEASVTIGSPGYSRGFNTKTTSPGYENLQGDLESLLDDFVSDYADYIYSQLEAEHDHLTSDESVIEDFANNDVLFDSDGVRL